MSPRTPDSLRARPFGRGSVSLGLHPDSGLSAHDQVEGLLAQAAEAESVGFDGVTVSEHHNGFPGYLPDPLLMSSWILGATQRVWSGPAPTLLGLRNPLLLAEQLAWTAARFPLRFGAVVAPGYVRSDFEHIDVPFDDRLSRFQANVDTMVGALGLSGEATVSADAALAGWRNSAAPLLVAANSRSGVRRAAARGLGVMFPGGEGGGRLGLLAEHYRESGGCGPVVWTRSVWLGRPRADALRQLDSQYRSAATSAMRQRTGFAANLLHGDPQRVLASLLDELDTVRPDAINLRLYLPGLSQAEQCDMIDRTGHEVVAGLREHWPGGSSQIGEI